MGKPLVKGSVGRLLPGLGLMLSATTVAVVIGLTQNVVGALVIALVLGVVVRNVGLFRPGVQPGVSVATKKLLRLGVVVLGLQLSLPDIVRLGLPTVGLIVACVLISFVVTRWVGQRLGLTKAGATLMAAGFSICGASAIAGMQGVVNADDEEVASSVAMVTLYGSLSILVLPLIGGALGLSDERFGIWSGLAVHEVAQVVATASTAGAVALAVATVVKLGRVVLLAPMAAVVSLGARRAELAATARAATLSGGSASAADGTVTTTDDTSGTVAKTPLVPLFVLGFLALVLVRSTGLVPVPVLDLAKLTATCLLAAAMFGLGTGIDVRKLARTGGRSLLVGGISTVLLGSIALGGAVLVAS